MCLQGSFLSVYHFLCFTLISLLKNKIYTRRSSSLSGVSGIVWLCLSKHTFSCLLVI